MQDRNEMLRQYQDAIERLLPIQERLRIARELAATGESQRVRREAAALAEKIEKRLVEDSQKAVQAFIEHYFSPEVCEDLAKVILELGEKEADKKAQKRTPAGNAGTRPERRGSS